MAGMNRKLHLCDVCGWPNEAARGYNCGMTIRDPITTREAANILGVTDSHIRLLVRRGELVGERFGREVAVSRKSAEKYQPKPRGRKPKSK